MILNVERFWCILGNVQQNPEDREIPRSSENQGTLLPGRQADVSRGTLICRKTLLGKFKILQTVDILVTFCLSVHTGTGTTVSFDGCCNALT